MTPDAMLAPEAAAVCTPLFWRMLPVRSMRNTAIEITAAGTEAETVMPANMPRYAFAAARTTASTQPRMITPTVSSGSDLLAGMYGSTLPAGAEELGASDMRETSSRTWLWVKVA